MKTTFLILPFCLKIICQIVRIQFLKFHFGYERNGNIIPIGGNQGNSLQFSSRNPSGDYGQTIVGYFLPENYIDNPEDEFKSEELTLDAKSLNKSELLSKSSNEISGRTT